MIASVNRRSHARTRALPLARAEAEVNDLDHRGDEADAGQGERQLLTGHRGAPVEARS